MKNAPLKTTVIHHSSDFDGIFCREIARKFLPDAELIGWDFGDKPHPGKADPFHQFYILDLPVDRVFGFNFSKSNPDAVASARYENVIWIDHHKSSIETHPKDIPGYRIDGVAACRLAWQWFANTLGPGNMSYISGLEKRHFFDRMVDEPLAVRLAGEYDIWDKRDPRAELFQFGLRARDLENCWDSLLGDSVSSDQSVEFLLRLGEPLQYARANEYRDVITQQGFDVEFEGLKFLACCSHECDIRSHLFEAGIKPHHDGLLGFTFTGKDWRVSLYGVPSKPELDLSPIAVKHGGGGHRQACGFRAQNLPWIP